MGQQPNIPLGIEDLPRATAHPAAANRWSPDRPGELSGPEAVPWGGAFGTPGPDTGYALTIVRRRDLPGGDHHRRDVEAAVVAVVAARASAIGRAPVPADVDVAVELLDLDAGVEHLAGIAHAPARLRGLVASIPRERLARIVAR